MKYTKDKKIGKNILAVLLVFAVFFTFPVSTAFASGVTTTSSTTSSSCTNNNHSMGVGNIGRWFNSRSEVQAYVSSVMESWNSKYTSGAITRDEYSKNCPTGYKAWSCSSCGKWTGDFKYYEAPTEPPISHTHNWDSGVVTKSATCTEKGVKTYTCSGCGATKTETITETGHKYVATVINPNCTTNGKTVYNCANCNSSYDADYIEAIGHDYKYVANNDGTHSKVCNACSDTIIEECNKIKLGNSIVCENCKVVYEDAKPTEPNPEPPTSHTHTWNNGEITKSATCTEKGVKTYTCSGCDETRTEAIAETDHNYVTTVIRPTCTTGGKTIHKCSNCNSSYEDAIVSATGHSYDNGVVTKSATCTTTGIKTYTCSKCKTTKTETISATGHKTVTDPAKLPTCTTTGLTAGSHCSVCNAVITAQKTVSATGHSYDKGKITKEATATTTGIKTYTCTKCKATKTEAISAKGLSTPNLKAVANSNGTFTLSWNKIDGAEKYELYIKQANGSYKLMKTTASTSFTTAVAVYGKQYTYKVRAVTSKNSSATSAYSAVVNAKNTKKLQTPNGVKVAVNKNGTFKLSWNKVTGAEKYELYIKQANGSYKLMKTTASTSFTTAVAVYGKQYTYKVRAVTSKNSSATSAYSAVVNAKNTKKLQTPNGVKVAVNQNGTFKLSWNKVTGADKYELYIKQANGSYKLMKTTASTSFTTAVAVYGKQYTYKVRAVTSKNSSATSAYSAVVNAKNTKKLQTPNGVKVAVNQNGTFKLSWNKVTGAEKYELYIKQANGSYKLMKTTASTSFTTAVASKGKTYSYKVKAVSNKNSTATSAFSSVVSAKRK